MQNWDHSITALFLTFKIWMCLDFLSLLLSGAQISVWFCAMFQKSEQWVQILNGNFFSYPPSSGIASCVRTIYMMMCHSGIPMFGSWSSALSKHKQYCVCFKAFAISSSKALFIHAFAEIQTRVAPTTVNGHLRQGQIRLRMRTVKAAIYRG